MKIAYVLYPVACYNGPGDGIRMQADIWAKELVRMGHQVDRISPWGQYDWNQYDIIHVFGFGLWVYDLIHWGSGLNANFVYSPIIDTNIPIWKYRLATYWGCSKLRLFSQNYAVRQLKNDVKLFFARTAFEADYLRRGYGIANDKIAIVPLSFREDYYDEIVEKENFCLFVGTMTQSRKNVPNLIRAAKKYGFRLKLVGNKGNATSEEILRKLIGNSSNIELVGFVTNEELTALYNRARVFALPSLNEGVGLVALEAAIHGCNIVITNIGGPKEYYEENEACLVNPYDIDDIGCAVMRAMEDRTSQPRLRENIIRKYNVTTCVQRLLDSYAKVSK